MEFLVEPGLATAGDEAFAGSTGTGSGTMGGVLAGQRLDFCPKPRIIAHRSPAGSEVTQATLDLSLRLLDISLIFDIIQSLSTISSDYSLVLS